MEDFFLITCATCLSRFQFILDKAEAILLTRRCHSLKFIGEGLEMVKISLFCDSGLKIWAIRVSVQLDYWQGSWEHRLFRHHCWSVGLLWHTQRSWPAAPSRCHSGLWVDRRTVGAPMLRDTGFAGTGSKGYWWQTPPYTEKTLGIICLVPEPWRKSSVILELVVWVSSSALPGESIANVSGHYSFGGILSC